eukprot:TRINITY_DN6722_c0_g1_i1.p1 TRINITY_DN6722_c0_g1~~TRINITY_DN6722_c0_g1_i1.p1  ORF type:complete len:1099 (+),score=245.47 TRINITY_DN6722_c0_g1_i1:67-3297(+)
MASQEGVAEKVLLLGPTERWHLHTDVDAHQETPSAVPRFEPVIRDCWPPLSAAARAAAESVGGGVEDEGELPLMLARLCLPAGCQTHVSGQEKGRRVSQWDVINAGAPAGPAIRKELPTFYTIVLTARASVLYGAVLSYWDHLDIDEESDMWAAVSEQRGHPSTAVPRRLGIVVQRGICVLSRFPFYTAFREFLCFLYRAVPSSPVPLERILGWFCGELPAPAPGGAAVQFMLGSRPVRLVRYAPASLPHLDIPLHKVLQVLPPDRLIMLLQCLLLERKVLLLSSQLSLLNWTIEAACTFLFPLRWDHIRIPLLPCWNRFAEVLQVPVPCIVGASAEWMSEDDRPPDTVLFHLDSGTVFMPPDRMPPPLPKKAARKLKTRLDEILRPFDLRRQVDIDGDCPFAVVRVIADGVDVLSPRRSTAPSHGLLPPTHPDFPARDVQMKIFRFFTSALKGYKQHLRTTADGTEFDSAAWVRSQEPEDRPFYEELSKTQLFMSSLVQGRMGSGNRLRPEVAACDAAIREKGSRRLLSRRSSERCITNALDAASGGGASAARTAVMPGVDDSGLPHRKWRYARVPKQFDHSLFGDYTKLAEIRAERMRKRPTDAEDHEAVATSWRAVSTQLSLAIERQQSQRSTMRPWHTRSSSPSRTGTRASLGRTDTGSSATLSMSAPDLGASPSAPTPKGGGDSPSCRGATPPAVGTCTPPACGDSSVVLELSCAGSSYRSWAVRERPNRSSKRVGTVPDGARMQFVERMGEWLRPEGLKGWVMESMTLEDGQSIGWRPIVGEAPPQLSPVGADELSGTRSSLDFTQSSSAWVTSPGATSPGGCPSAAPIQPPQIIDVHQSADPPSDPSSVAGLSQTVSTTTSPRDADDWSSVDAHGNVHFQGCTVQFNCTVQCPCCSALLEEQTVVDRMHSSTGDYRTQCTKCRHAFRPSFVVSVMVRGQRPPSRCHKELVTYLTPQHMQREFEGLLRQRVTADEGLLHRHPTLFWNLVRHCRSLAVAPPSMLPQADMAKLGASLCVLAGCPAARGQTASDPPTEPDQVPTRSLSSYLAEEDRAGPSEVTHDAAQSHSPS